MIASALPLHLARLVLFLVVGLGAVVFADKSKDKDWAGTLTVAAALVGFAAMMGLQSLGGLIAAMHKPDATPVGIGTLTGGNVDLVRRGFLDLALWYQRGAVFKEAASPGFAIKWFFLLDSLVFVPMYAMFLTLVSQRMQGHLGRMTRKERRTTTRTRDDAERISSTQGGLAWYAGLLVIPLVILDVLENVLTMTMSGLIEQPFTDPDQVRRVLEGRPSSAVIGWVHVVSWAKWATSAVLLLLLVLAAARVVFLHRAEIASCFRSIFRIRGVFGVVLLYAALVMVPLQIPDVFRSWDVGHSAIAAAISVVIGVFAYVFAGQVMNATRRPGVKVGPWGLFSAGVVLLVAGGLSVWIDWGAPGLIIPGVVFLLVSLLGLVAEDVQASSPRAAGVGRKALPRILAAVPVAALGLAAFKALFADTVYLQSAAHWWWGALILAGWGLLPPLLAVGMYLGARYAEDHPPKGKVFTWLRRGLIACGAIAALIWFQVIRNVWKNGEFFGAVALVEIFILLLIIGVGLLSRWVERTGPPKGISAIGLKRSPVFVLALVWLLFAGRVGGTEFHDVRVESGTLPADQAELLPTTPQQAFTNWMSRQSPIGTGTRKVIPMVFVATAGGGIKAATWTAFVLDCVLHGGPGVDKEPSLSTCRKTNADEVDRTSSVFAASGISGGSLGLVEFATHEVESNGAPDPGWIRRVLAQDFVGPNLGWQLFVEAPRSLLRYDIGMDRGEVLERAWGLAWRAAAPSRLSDLLEKDDGFEGALDDGFLAQRAAHPELPLLLLNGTTVEAGCRFVTSPIRTSGELPGRDCSNLPQIAQTPIPGVPAATQDLRQFLCTGKDGTLDDIRLSTAALLSSRFPYVSPSGRLVMCGTDPEVSVHVVDGGYLDGSGGASARELWDAVSADVDAWNTDASRTSCIVPYFIQISSGYESTLPPGEGNVSEPRVPPTTEARGRGERSVEGRNAAALAFRQDLPGTGKSDRYAILYLRAHPGAAAPLGWTLSRASVDELERQLDSNDDQLSEIASWFSDKNSCG